mmetsp:Transcript_43639/g.100673  ORF Transcript_43639/g.100673 Transcript_43639/m.100673 type:complete len:849 (+) Transcript_43639:118-2664(+)
MTMYTVPEGAVGHHQVVVPTSPTVRLPQLGLNAKPCNWRSQLFEPVLRSCSEEHPPTPLGGPPRQAVRQADHSSFRKREEGLEHKLRRAGRHHIKEIHRPLQPRLAVRRLRLAREAKQVESPCAAMRPPSPASVKESLYVRDIVGKSSLLRGYITDEAERYSAEYRELADHRMSARREAERVDRAQAVQWREMSSREEGLFAIRWKLMHSDALGVRQDANEESRGDGTSRPADPAQSRASSAEVSSAVGQRPQLVAALKHYRRWRSKTTGLGSDGSNASDEDATASGATHARSSRLKSLPRPKKSLKARMRVLHQVAKARRCTTKDVSPPRRIEEGSESVANSSPASSPRQKNSIIFGRPKAELLNRKTMMMDVLETKVLPDAGERAKSSLDKDTASFHRVFDHYDRGSTGYIDQAELRNVLKELGLHGRTDAERVLIRQVLWRAPDLKVSYAEFTDKIVPDVRQRLLGLRQEHMRDIFEEVCEDMSGRLSLNDVAYVLRCCAVFPSEETILDALADTDQKTYESVRTLGGTWLRDKPVLLFDKFCQILDLVQEREERENLETFKQLAIQYGIAESAQEGWRPMLAELQKAHGEAVKAAGLSEVPQVIALLRKMALVPRTKGISGTLPLTIRSIERISSSEGMSLGGLVRVVNKLWEDERQLIDGIFSKHDTAGKGSLTLTEMLLALADYGVEKRNDDEGDFIVRCLEEFDDVGAKEVEKEDFGACCHHVTWRLSWRRHEKVKREALEFGWTEDQFDDAQAAFMAIDEDMSEYLDREEIFKALAMINPGVRMDAFSVFPAIGLNPSAADLQIHFGEFLKLMMHLDLKDRSKYKTSGSTESLLPASTEA